MLELIREELSAQGINSVGMQISLIEAELETIKKFNETGDRNHAIQYYRNFKELMYQSFPEQRKTLEKFVDKAHLTTEHVGFILTLDTIDIQYHEVYLREKVRDLKLTQ